MNVQKKQPGVQSRSLSTQKLYLVHDYWLCSGINLNTPDTTHYLYKPQEVPGIFLYTAYTQGSSTKLTIKPDNFRVKLKQIWFQTNRARAATISRADRDRVGSAGCWGSSPGSWPMRSRVNAPKSQNLRPGRVQVAQLEAVRAFNLKFKSPIQRSRLRWDWTYYCGASDSSQARPGPVVWAVCCIYFSKNY